MPKTVKIDCCFLYLGEEYFYGSQTPSVQNFLKFYMLHFVK